MESYLINGGVPLHGEVQISGAKTPWLPISAPRSSLATVRHPATFPALRRDVHRPPILTGSVPKWISRAHGPRSTPKNRVAWAITIRRSRPQMPAARFASGSAAGVEKNDRLIARRCASRRASDQSSLKSVLKRSGAKIKNRKRYVKASANDCSARIYFFSAGRAGSHRAWHLQLYDAATPRGRRDRDRKARRCETEVVDVANFLNSMGAKISGAGAARRLRFTRQETARRGLKYKPRPHSKREPMPSPHSPRRIAQSPCFSQRGGSLATRVLGTSLFVRRKIERSASGHHRSPGLEHLKPLVHHHPALPCFPTTFRAQDMSLDDHDTRLTQSTIKPNDFLNIELQCTHELTLLGADIEI